MDFSRLTPMTGAFEAGLPFGGNTVSNPFGSLEAVIHELCHLCTIPRSPLGAALGAKHVGGDKSLLMIVDACLQAALKAASITKTREIHRWWNEREVETLAVEVLVLRMFCWDPTVIEELCEKAASNALHHPLANRPEKVMVLVVGQLGEEKIALARRVIHFLLRHTPRRRRLSLKP